MKLQINYKKPIKLKIKNFSNKAGVENPCLYVQAINENIGVICLEFYCKEKNLYKLRNSKFSFFIPNYYDLYQTFKSRRSVKSKEKFTKITNTTHMSISDIADMICFFRTNLRKWK